MQRRTFVLALPPGLLGLSGSAFAADPFPFQADPLRGAGRARRRQ